MFAHVIEGFLPRRFCKLKISADLAAKDRLKAADQIADDAARAHGDAANDAMISLVVETIIANFLSSFEKSLD
jgi:hypothetical protein